MKIRYDEQGRILGAYADHLEVPGNVVKVEDKTLKKDFRSTFSLGKYHVKDGKIKAVRGFRPHSTKKLEGLMGFEFPGKEK